MSDANLDKRKTSTKEGLESSAEKEASTRHGTGRDPAAQPVAGAFGKPGESLERGWDPTRQPADPNGALIESEEEPNKAEEE